MEDDIRTLRLIERMTPTWDTEDIELLESYFASVYAANTLAEAF